MLEICVYHFEEIVATIFFYSERGKRNVIMTASWVTVRVVVSPLSPPQVKLLVRFVQCISICFVGLVAHGGFYRLLAWSILDSVRLTLLSDFILALFYHVWSNMVSCVICKNLNICCILAKPFLSIVLLNKLQSQNNSTVEENEWQVDDLKK